MYVGTTSAAAAGLLASCNHCILPSLPFSDVGNVANEVCAQRKHHLPHVALVPHGLWAEAAQRGNITLDCHTATAAATTTWLAAGGAEFTQNLPNVPPTPTMPLPSYTPAVYHKPEMSTCSQAHV